jgi:addiction module RelB/DinJ family antitoxin
MATKTITVRVDEDVKNQAEIILDDIGLTVTTLFNACLKAVVREKKVPFALVSHGYSYKSAMKEAGSDEGFLKRTLACDNDFSVVDSEVNGEW